VEGLELALRRQDSAVEKLQAGAKRHMEASLRQGTTRKNLQQATQKEDKLRHQLTRTEAELAATRRCPACTLLLMSFAASECCSVLVFPANCLFCSTCRQWDTYKLCNSHARMAPCLAFAT